MAARARDWFQQAERDLEQAEASRREKRHEWACFAAQQSAEKAVKALHLALGQDAWGHVVARLLSELPIDVPEDLVEKAILRVSYFGSYARGNWGVGSDLDIVVIMAECELPPEQRGLAFDTITGLPVPVDLLVYTAEEWEQLRADGAAFVRGIEAEAVWVAEPAPAVNA